MVKRLNYNPETVRKLLEKRDFLTEHPREDYIRSKNFFIYVAGPKGSGKSKFSDLTHLALQDKKYPAITSRASLDADPTYVNHRKEMLKKQEKKDQDLKWYQVIGALREEAVSAFRSQNISDFLVGNGNSKKRILLLNRYPLVDTLAFQYLEKSPLEGVAQYLKGANDLETSGYIKPDLVLIFTCNGAEANRRVIRRDSKLARGEVTATIPGDPAGRIDRQIKALYKISGYDPSEKTFNNKLKAFPGETYIITTDTNIDYTLTPDDEIDRMAEQIIRANVKKVLEEIILPAIEKKR